MKTAIVTGGSKGIGLGIVRMLACRGYKVFATYGHDDNAAHTAAAELGDKVEFVKADLADRSQTYAFVSHVKQASASIDCIVCNAGTTIRKSFTETTDSDWDTMMEVGLTAHLILLRELYQIIKPGGHVLFTGSAMGLHPHATVLGYGVVTAAVHAMVKNLVKVFEDKSVTVNAVAPGFVETEWQKEKPQQIRENICRKTALHRFASIDEIVSAFAFCLDNSYVNGSVLEITGGYSYR